MSSKKELNRYKVQVLFESGLKPKQIIIQTGFNQSFVYYWIKAFRDERGFKDKPRSGRPTKLNPEMRNEIIEIAKTTPTSSLKEIACEFERGSNVKISNMTVFRVLKINGLKSYICPCKPRLTDKQKAKRLKFVKENQKRDWSKVLFTDECDFQLYRIGRKRVWAKKRSDVPIIPTVKYAPKLKIWGGISAKGKTPLVFYEGRLNAERYTSEVLKKGIEKIKMGQIFGKSKWTFQHDGAPAHFAKKTNKWLKKKVPEFISSGAKGEWPAQSPDLNPIENLWAIMKRRVQAANPKYLEELKSILIQVWNEIDIPMLENLVLSMPRRFLQVLDRGGGQTKY